MEGLSNEIKQLGGIVKEYRISAVATVDDKQYNDKAVCEQVVADDKGNAYNGKYPVIVSLINTQLKRAGYLKALVAARGQAPSKDGKVKGVKRGRKLEPIE